MLAELGGQGQQVALVPAAEQGFGRYQLLYRFAIGGMGSIYLGRFPGPDGFEKLVAIKRIHDHLTALPQFVAMFKDEARLAARISHPNVVQVIELGQCNSSHFIAMEYVEGESLAALLRRRRIPYPVAARIIADALGGLHAAHELRNAKEELLHLVHRDLSPSNILVSYEGAVKVVDFGVARARGNLSVTDAGTVKAKLAYMSPEQVRNLPLDRRSDLFTMGTLLYECSVYKRLFHAESDAATVAKILECAIPAPSTVREDFPPKLEAVLKKALAKLPGERYATAREMQLAIEEYIFSSGAPVLPSTVGDLMRATFADQIVAKKQLLLGGAPPSPEVLSVIAPDSSGASLDLGSNGVAAPASPTAGAPAPFTVEPEREEREDSTLDLEPEDLEEVAGTVPPVPGMPPVPPPPLAASAPVASDSAIAKADAWKEAPSAATRLDLADLSRLPPKRTLFAIGGVAVTLLAAILLLLLWGRGDKVAVPVRVPDLAVAKSKPAAAARPDARVARPDRAPPRPDLRAPDLRAPDLRAPDLTRPAITRPPDARPPRAAPDLSPKAEPKTKKKPARKKKGLFGNPYDD